MTPVNVFIFRRDLRLEDNLGLIEATKDGAAILPCFIFNPAQLENNSYRSDNAVQFMLHSIEELGRSIQAKGGRLLKFFGRPGEVLGRLLDEPSIKVSSVFVNTDYTPFSKERDLSLQAECKKRGVEFRAFHDSLLAVPGSVLKKDGTPYTIFTPFKKAAQKLAVLAPQKLPKIHFLNQNLPLESKLPEKRILSSLNQKIALAGGRDEGLKLLKQALTLENYSDLRNLPAIKGTSRLSAHNKFGTLSIREVYQALTRQFGVEHTLISELYWRDFFTHIAWHFPHVFGGSFHKHFDKIEWTNDQTNFKRWCDGETGFPIVDAGMRELNQSGFMHNRVRMIVASFLTKDLHIDWRWGEKYFANKLIDYDPAVNNGNWQWSASTGCDAQPYFRIFNPWLQQERFDPECKYIKHWVSELEALDPKEINDSSRTTSINKYPPPIVDHSWAKGEAEALFRAAAKG